MKKLFTGLLATAFFTLSSFSVLPSTKSIKKNKIVYPSHNCLMKMYSNGEFVGYYTVYNVPIDMDCNLPAVRDTAINGWNESH